MTDVNRYRNVSITHETHKKLTLISKFLMPHTNLSISKTIEALSNEKIKKLNGKTK